MLKQHLSRDIAILLTVKVVALFAIYFAFFASPSRTPIDPAAHVAGLNGAVVSSPTR